MAQGPFRAFVERYLAEQEDLIRQESDRRVAPRHEIRRSVAGTLVKAYVSLHIGEEPPQLEVLDISRTGAALYSDVRLYPGEVVEFELELAGGQKRLLRADVVYCVPSGPKQFRSGTRFMIENEPSS